MLHATRTMRRHGGDAVQETYARGGGWSGAEPDETGILTVSAMAPFEDDMPDEAKPSPGVAPSAVTHAVPMMQGPCAGTEHGA